jgi:hypothetical protein
VSNDPTNEISAIMVQPIVYRGRVVAVASRRGCVFGADLDDETYRMAAAMCLFHGELVHGHVTGPFTSERAERWARAFLEGARDGPG